MVNLFTCYLIPGSLAQVQLYRILSSASEFKSAEMANQIVKMDD